MSDPPPGVERFSGCKNRRHSYGSGTLGINSKVKKLVAGFVTRWDGSTPVLIAVDKGHITILQKLLKAGADLRVSRNNGMNAFTIAVSKNDDKTFFLLWNHFDKKDNWILNQENSDGYTILMIAVERGFVEFAKFFSSLGVVQVDHQTKDGRSALMLAAMRSQPEIVRSLLECNASVLLEDKVSSKDSS
ncbi:uncharacterized protein TNCV_4385191 [Trichonephila clavipes]|nr:uncharacterized protein TNCV_4385191 [Trichonephila clavipes]